MQLVDTIRVPRTPYGSTFSHDGARFAIGGGTWYGNGGIIVRALQDGTDVTLHWEDFRDNAMLFPEPFRIAVEIYMDNWTRFDRPYAIGLPAVSSLCFSDDDRYLAASMWRARWSYAPAAVFGTGTIQLTLEAVIEGQPANYVLHTGVVMHRGHIVVRRHVWDAWNQQQAAWLAVHPLPLLSSSANGGNDHLTHSRVVVRRGAALTSGAAFATSDRARHRLIANALDGAGAEHIEVSDTRGVSAISACREDDRFISGGFDGEIDLWQWDSGWHSTRVRQRTNEGDNIRELVTTRRGQLGGGNGRWRVARRLAGRRSPSSDLIEACAWSPEPGAWSLEPTGSEAC